MKKTSLKQEILKALRRSGTSGCQFTSVEMADILDYHNVTYSKRSLSAMLSTLVKQRWLQKVGTRPANKGRALVVYAWKGKKYDLYDLPALSSEEDPTAATVTTTTKTVGDVSHTVTKYSKKADSNNLDYADIGRALVENVFEMRNMLKEQGKELARIKLELQDRISQCKDANKTIEKKNEKIERLIRERFSSQALITKLSRDQYNQKPHSSFKLSEIATIKG